MDQALTVLCTLLVVIIVAAVIADWRSKKRLEELRKMRKALDPTVDELDETISKLEKLLSAPKENARKKGGPFAIAAEDEGDALAQLALSMTTHDHENEGECAGCAMRNLAQALVRIARKQDDFSDEEIITRIQGIMEGAPNAASFGGTKH